MYTEFYIKFIIKFVHNYNSISIK